MLCDGCAEDAPVKVTVDDITYKIIAQIIYSNDHTRQEDVIFKNENKEQCFQMHRRNSGVYGGPETG